MKRLTAILLSLVLLMALAVPGVAETAKIELTLSHWGSTADAEVYQARVDLFNAQSDTIHVTINYIPEDYATKITSMMSSGTAPDVMVLAEEANSFAYRGQLLPLNDYLSEAGIDLVASVGQACVDAYSYDGSIYGISSSDDCIRR